MERFYTCYLLRFANRHPDHLQIAKRFLCPKWEMINSNDIQKTNIKNEFLVPSTKNNSVLYIVNSEIGMCSCPVDMSDASYKHQGAVSIKFHISMFNFILLLTLDDHIIYIYIALGKSNIFLLDLLFI